MDTKEGQARDARNVPVRPDAPGLQRSELMVLTALRDRIEPPGDALSGHALREMLQRTGLAKLDVTLATRSLVGLGLIARVRRDDADGRFYTAYRLTAQGEAWLREHVDVAQSIHGG